MTKYLSSDPMVFGQYNRINTHKDDSGGPSHEIPAEDRCPSGRHNKRLTECWCEPEKFVVSCGVVKMNQRCVDTISLYRADLTGNAVIEIGYCACAHYAERGWCFHEGGSK